VISVSSVSLSVIIIIITHFIIFQTEISIFILES